MPLCSPGVAARRSCLPDRIARHLSPAGGEQDEQDEWAAETLHQADRQGACARDGIHQSSVWSVLNLLAVDSSANRAKGDGDTATWLPSYKAYRCAYVARQVAVKGKYGLWVTSAERDAMTRVLTTCPSMGLPGPGSAPVVAVLPRTASSPAPQFAPAPAPVAGVTFDANCTAVRAAGAAPIHRGDPGFASKLDGDGDGSGCE